MVLEPFFDNLQFVKRYSLHTISAYRTDLHQFAEYLSNVYEIGEPEEVSQAVVRSWLASLIDSGQSHRSVNRKLSSIKAYFNFLVREGLLSSNVASRVSTLKIPGHLPVSASRSEMEHVFSGEEQEGSFGSRRDFLILELLYSTGIRLSELINLKVSDVDSSLMSIKVTGKRNKQRIIPISKPLIDRITAYLLERERLVDAGVSEIIITDRGKKAYSVFIYRTVTRYLGEAGVKGRKSPHVLRHTFATHMLNEGADLNAIKELLGHASLAATQVYTHVSVEKLKSIYKLAHPRA
ncbi:MAG: tyrosine-type recombinase/integrase [Lentimicrobium sp.]|jgi:integrase/recombinase XerC|nr:tyrosine-type recombinase/integrase [Lentimicrobium sp.]